MLIQGCLFIMLENLCNPCLIHQPLFLKLQLYNNYFVLFPTILVFFLVCICMIVPLHLFCTARLMVIAKRYLITRLPFHFFFISLSLFLLLRRNKNVDGFFFQNYLSRAVQKCRLVQDYVLGWPSF